MAIYEFNYVREDGTQVTVEKMMRISEICDEITIVDPEDFRVYTATRTPISITANMKDTWEYDTKNSDLPPVDWTPDQG